LRPVEAPDHYWAQVISSALSDDSFTFDNYQRAEHPYAEQWFTQHWDLAERLLDDPAYDHIRFHAFDAEDLAYRYAITAIQDPAGTIVLTEFRLLD
jgi:hypothetical protein